MKLRISFRQLNKDFSQIMAAEWNGGEEGLDNSKIKFSKGFETINEKDALKRLKEVNLQFESSDGVKSDKSMEVVRWWNNDIEFTAGVESSLLDKVDIFYNKKGDKEYAYFYIDPDKEFIFVNDSILEKPIFAIEKIMT